MKFAIKVHFKLECLSSCHKRREMIEEFQTVEKIYIEIKLQIIIQEKIKYIYEHVLLNCREFSCLSFQAS